MKKPIALLLLLALTLTAAALATPMEMDMGDFTLTIDEDAPGEMNEKANGQVYFTIYEQDPSGSFANNLNCVWTDSYQDMTTVDPDAAMDTVLAGIEAQAEAAGVSFTNIQKLDATQTELSGRSAVMLYWSYDADYSGMGVDLQASLYALQFIVSDPTDMTYSFTVTADSQTSIDGLRAIFDTLVWKH